MKLTRSITYFLRDLFNRRLFVDLGHYAKGDVLDVGGGTFYEIVLSKNIKFNSWTSVDPCVSASGLVHQSPPVRLLKADGSSIPLPDQSFDLVLSIQVLEHVYDPFRVLEESARLCKKGGKLILLLPQTGNIHMIPHHYYNFTRFWIEKALPSAGFEIEKLVGIGGAWSTIASRMIYLVFQAFRATGLSSRALYPRKKLFYIMFPFMLLFVAVSVPVCLLFSLADLAEEPNNHYVIATRI